ncbi:histone H1-like [Ctenocephalides felis]|nr:histone H1-like [Ctenocephalides felis]XP_026475519.1 histone H1-like [Ctenocephalides felis]XP_026475558.1 histone H1-like [Ctenocephalides felis]XP_026475715.1 histone H1-like [Ctenocephalides felis]XP_026475954.1 histone H1-like [Ctenocephalides felis]XP_026475982.1 histone H1-like [Ctenocephalides felis]XP_026476305.1 histone H1-like [Ctenocephalides felis]
MSDNALSASPVGTAAPATASSSEAVPSKKKRVRAPYPPIYVMVNDAIASLKKRGGSSLQAIKKYMSANYKIDAEKKSTYIRKYLMSAVEMGTLIHTRGNGASGSYKLAARQRGGESGVSAGKARTAKKPAIKIKSKTAKSKGAAKPASSLKKKSASAAGTLKKSSAKPKTTVELG